MEFVFVEVDRRDGMQIILIECAYIAYGTFYVEAASGRWTRGSGEVAASRLAVAPPPTHNI